MNRIEVHRVNQVSPRFVLSPVCQCPIHFTGLLCNTPTDACALANCPASRLCIPHGLNDYSCICPPPRTGPNCESLLIYGDGRDDCHSESCFNQRGKINKCYGSRFYFLFHLIYTLSTGR